jgi:hypothetical protein
MSAVLECWCFGDPWYIDEYIPRQNYFTNLAQALHAIASKFFKKNEGYMLHTGAVILPLLIIMHHK